MCKEVWGRCGRVYGLSVVEVCWGVGEDVRCKEVCQGEVWESVWGEIGEVCWGVEVKGRCVERWGEVQGEVRGKYGGSGKVQ